MNYVLQEVVMYNEMVRKMSADLLFLMSVIHVFVYAHRAIWNNTAKTVYSVSQRDQTTSCTSLAEKTTFNHQSSVAATNILQCFNLLTHFEYWFYKFDCAFRRDDERELSWVEKLGMVAYSHVTVTLTVSWLNAIARGMHLRNGGQFQAALRAARRLVPCRFENK